ncbi:DgyrCDS11435 [Dimorphilus gyrociliatus]|uniref:DgyrCDS11435 n=1 Tax=Dimorphilus gyrociliatus TaxID=2664684 RepID=A0A7I8W4M1_9ANNE|nr:DgyrCDS11435 [Dimorphilus gyrociliatus]
MNYQAPNTRQPNVNMVQQHQPYRQFAPGVQSMPMYQVMYTPQVIQRPYHSRNVPPPPYNIQTRPKANPSQHEQKLNKEEFEKQMKLKKFEDQKKRLMQFSSVGFKSNVSADHLIKNILGPETTKKTPSDNSKNIPASQLKTPTIEDDGFGEFIQVPTQSTALPTPTPAVTNNTTGLNANIPPANKEQDLMSMMISCSNLSDQGKAKTFNKSQSLKQVQPKVQNVKTYQQSTKSRAWTGLEQDLSGIFTAPGNPQQISTYQPQPQIQPQLQQNPQQQLPQQYLQQRQLQQQLPHHQLSQQQLQHQTSRQQLPQQQLPQQQPQSRHQLQQQAAQQINQEQTSDNSLSTATSSVVSQEKANLEVDVYEVIPWLNGKVQVPEVYYQVLEASTLNGFISTDLVYGILLRSGLPREILGYLWDLCNRETAGQLNKAELFAILALIAIVQNNISVTSLNDLLRYNDPPLPNLGQSTVNQVQKDNNGVIDTDLVQTSVTDVSENLQSQPISDDFADFQAAPANINTNFANFPSLPQDISNDSRELPTFKSSTSGKKTDNLNNKEIMDDTEEFNDFCSVPPIDSNSKVQSLDKIKSLISESTYVCPDNNMKSTSSASDTVTNDTSRSFSGSSDMFSMSSHSDSGAVSSANSEDWSDGIGLPSAKSKPREEIDIKKSNLFFSKNNEKPVVIGTGLNPYDTTPPEMNDYVDGDNDEEFYSNPTTFYDLDEDCGLDDAHNAGSSMYNEKSKKKTTGNALKSSDRIQDAQSVSSLDLPTSKPSDTKSVSSLEIKHSATSEALHQSSTVQMDSIPKSRSAQDVLQEDVSPVADRYRDLRKSPIEEKENSHSEKWMDCIKAANEVLITACNILSSCDETVLTEVLSSSSGYNYILDVIEAYRVVRRIIVAIRSMTLQDNRLNECVNDTEMSWAKLTSMIAHTDVMPQADKLDMSEHVLSPSSVDCDSEVAQRSCGVCLLDVQAGDEPKLVYGSRAYHSSCANIWVNCVDTVLPALKLPTLL